MNSEYVHADVRSAAVGNPTFSGYYLTGSWVVTGGHRPYDRKAGYARRVLPQGEWGAIELMARIGRIDLDDAAVEGGTMNGCWVGIKWWATRRGRRASAAGISTSNVSG
jgi:phosphate-selective porin OprO and OprP